MDNTLRQLLEELANTSIELRRVEEMLRLLQAEYTDLKNKVEKGSRSGADKGI